MTNKSLKIHGGSFYDAYYKFKRLAHDADPVARVYGRINLAI